MDTRTLTMGFTAEVCYKVECGVAWMLENGFMAARRSDGGAFYCPNGHRQHYIDTVEARLRRQLEQANRNTEYQRGLKERYDRQRAAALGQVTRIRNRIEKGVCPKCNRSFCNLRRHMASKHPRKAAQGKS